MLPVGNLLIYANRMMNRADAATRDTLRNWLVCTEMDPVGRIEAAGRKCGPQGRVPTEYLQEPSSAGKFILLRALVDDRRESGRRDAAA